MKSSATSAVKQTLKPDAYKQSEPSFTVGSKIKPLGVGAAKASLNRAIELHAVDPKPGDLAMGRLKVG